MLQVRWNTDQLPLLMNIEQWSVFVYAPGFMLSNIQEIHARRGKLIILATEGDNKIKQLSREVIYIPRIDEFFSPLLASLPLQLLAYFIAVKRGCDVDQPRNLAKSVTVE